MLPLLIPFGISSAIGYAVGRKVFDGKGRSKSKSKINPLKQAGLPTVRIEREIVVEERSLILAREEIPLDNRFGNQILTSEHEFARSATVALEVERSREMGTAFRTTFWKLFETRASGELAKSLGVEIGSHLTRRVRLKFAASPGELVRYRVVWKQESRRGVFEVRIGNKAFQIPYMVRYGLFHSVESLDSGPDAGGITTIEEPV
ncbi:MAG: hypothetical protein HQL52_14795 [Magnetococcales bacterium]|nr:hypothetical protein [Magnetococcales bacterium]